MQPNFFKKVEIGGCAAGSLPVLYIERATKYATRSLGSAGEHRLHTAGVTGSNPVATTTNDKAGIKWFRPFSFKGVEVSMPVEVATCFKRDKGAFRESERHRVDRACSSTVEQGTHNPLVLGSNPGGPTKTFSARSFVLLAFSWASFQYWKEAQSGDRGCARIMGIVGDVFPVSSSGHRRNPVVRAIMGGNENAAWIFGGIFIATLMRSGFRLTD